MQVWVTRFSQVFTSAGQNIFAQLNSVDIFLYCIFLGIASQLTDSALGVEFLSEDPQALYDYVIHYDKATPLDSLTPCHITGDHVLWRRFLIEIV